MHTVPSFEGAGKQKLVYTLTLYYPTNAQYIIWRYNYNYKIFKSAPICFGSQWIHHCLAFRKTVPSYTVNYTQAQRDRICCHITELVHVNGHYRIILVIFSQALYKVPW